MVTVVSWSLSVSYTVCVWLGGAAINKVPTYHFTQKTHIACQSTTLTDSRSLPEKNQKGLKQIPVRLTGKSPHSRPPRTALRCLRDAEQPAARGQRA